MTCPEEQPEEPGTIEDQASRDTASEPQLLAFTSKTTQHGSQNCWSTFNVCVWQYWPCPFWLRANSSPYVHQASCLLCDLHVSLLFPSQLSVTAPYIRCQLKFFLFLFLIQPPNASEKGADNIPHTWVSFTQVRDQCGILALCIDLAQLLWATEESTIGG